MILILNEKNLTISVSVLLDNNTDHRDFSVNDFFGINYILVFSSVLLFAFPFKDTRLQYSVLKQTTR